MKKKIAVFANGWSYEYLQGVMQGIRKNAEENNIDIFLFTNFSSYNRVQNENQGELNIYRLPKLDEFDGVLLMTNTFNSEEEKEYLHQEVLRCKVPAITFAYELQGIDYLGTDNYSGMYELAEHMIKVHDVKQILIIGGPKDNGESQERIKAIIEAAEKYNVVIDDEHIIYSDWGYYRTQELLQDWLESQNYVLPDVIMCANDDMALGVCEHLERLGRQVPKDTFLTGYDALEAGKYYYPSFASVSKNWKNMGYKAMSLLMDKMAGQQIPEKTIVDSVMHIGESCGCTLSGEMEKQRVKKMILQSNSKIGNMNFDHHFRTLFKALRKVVLFEELNPTIGSFMEYDTTYEGNDFLLCLEPGYFSTDELWDSSKTDGYSENLYVACALKDGKNTGQKSIDISKLLLNYDEKSKEAKLYIFVPLISEHFSIGYAVLNGNMKVFDEYKLYTWTRHMSQYLEMVRQNIKLEQLSDRLKDLSMTDGLTGLYNRLGYEETAIPFLDKCREQKKQSIIMIADINKMKIINDVHGHMQGDVAICTVAKVLKNELPEDWVKVRYGGDEFLIIGDCASEAEADAYVHQVETKIKEQVENMKLPFELSVSLGKVLVEPTVDIDLERCLQDADKEMYLVKAVHHQKYSGM